MIIKESRKDNMAEVNLLVPYKSQWDDDAHGTANDCGPTSAAMILNYYDSKLNVTTDQIYALTGAGKGLITIPQMIKAISSLGYQAEFKIGYTVDQLKAFLDAKTPVIALVHYGSLISVQDKNYKDGHFFTVVGYRDDGYFVNDPNFQGNLRQDGDHHFFTKAEFEKAWADCYVDSNPVNSLIVINNKNAQPTDPVTQKTYPFTPMTRNVVVMPDTGCYVRSEPTTADKNITRALTKGISIAVEGYVIGEAVSGNNIWWKIKDKVEYVWSGATNFIPSVTPDPTPAAPTQPAPSANPAPADNSAQLQKQVDTLLQQVKYLTIKEQGMEKDNAQLEQDKEDLQKKLDAFGNQNFDTVKEANQILTEKNKELQDQRDNAYIKAFTGWTLTSVLAGVNPLTKLSLIGKILAFNPKSQYVVGWKEGATLYRVDGQQEAINAQDATASTLQPKA